MVSVGLRLEDPLLGTGAARPCFQRTRVGSVPNGVFFVPLRVRGLGALFDLGVLPMGLTALWKAAAPGAKWETSIVPSKDRKLERARRNFKLRCPFPLHPLTHLPAFCRLSLGAT